MESSRWERELEEEIATSERHGRPVPPWGQRITGSLTPEVVARARGAVQAHHDAVNEGRERARRASR